MARALDGLDVPVLVVGNGSNLLVADAGFAGLVVTLGPGFADLAIDGTEVRAGGAAGPARPGPAHRRGRADRPRVGGRGARLGRAAPCG